MNPLVMIMFSKLSYGLCKQQRFSIAQQNINGHDVYNRKLALILEKDWEQPEPKSKY